MASIVDRLHSEFQQLASLLDAQVEPSLRITADDTFKKVLLLSAASHFERAVIDAISTFVSRASSGNERVVEFARRKGLSRQYHTLFDWERDNANRFFSLFGDTFKTTMEARVKSDSALRDAIRGFMDIGQDRNRLIHEDMGQFVLEKTAEEIYAQYQLAANFVDALPQLLEGGGVDTAST